MNEKELLIKEIKGILGVESSHSLMSCSVDELKEIKKDLHLSGNGERTIPRVFYKLLRMVGLG